MSEDRSIRVMTIARIVEIFMRGKTTTSSAWRIDAMHFATYVDSILFAAAETFAEYEDPKTLDGRVLDALRGIGPQTAIPIDGKMRNALNNLDFMSADRERINEAFITIQLSVTSVDLQTKYGLLNCVRRVQRCAALHLADAETTRAAMSAIGILCFRHQANQSACDVRAINAAIQKHAKNRDVVMCGLSTMLDITSLSHDMEDSCSEVTDQV